MRIAKYFLLLVMLFGFALLVFVFTQDGKFEINKSKTIKNLNKNIVYNYLENFKNWNEFIIDSKKPNYEKNKFLWEKNQYVFKEKHKNDSLILNFNKEGNESLLRINFKKNQNSTVINWKIKGNYTYKEKFLAFFYGNNNRKQINKIESYLNSIDQNLQKEHFYYNIKYDKIITQEEQTLIFKTINCSINNQENKIKETITKLFKTLDSVKILPVKKPFIVYSWKDYVTQNTKFNLCVEIPKYSDTLLSKKQTLLKAKNSYQIVEYNGNKKFLPQFWNNFTTEIKNRNMFYLKNQGIIENINENNTSLIKKSEYKTQILIPIYQNKTTKPNQSKTYSNTKKTVINTERPKIEPIQQQEIKPIENNPIEKTTEN